MVVKVKKNDIINMMIICLPLCPYKLFSIADKDISAIYLIWGILIVFGVLDITNLIRSLKKNWIILIEILYILLNSLIRNNDNVGSITQFIILWSILFLSYRKVTYSEFDSTVNLFHKVMDFMAIYGLYELVGRLVGLPLSDLWIPGHMVEGYNWYNNVNIGGIVVSRSNGIFVEPSTYSQYLAINILLYLFSDIETRKKNTKKIILNGFALICGFSGTGILLLFLGILFFFLSRGGGKVIAKVIRKYRTWVFISVIAIIVICFSPLGSFMLSRLSEFDPTNMQSVSGYIRFVGPYRISLSAIEKNLYWGIGIGNLTQFITIYRTTGGAATYASVACSVIVARYLAELGIIGVVILLCIYKNFFKKERLVNINYKILLMCSIVLIPLCDSDISVNYWFILYLINIDFKESTVLEANNGA